jgi:hypothetical protein
MLLNAVELQSYLHCAFDHFALTLEEAFDFVQASFLNNPIPMDFGGNILRLSIKMVAQHGHRRPDPRDIFGRLSQLIASCIMLDSVRHEIRGISDRLLSLLDYTDEYQEPLTGFSRNIWTTSILRSRISAIDIGLASTLRKVRSIQKDFSTLTASPAIAT